MTMSVSFGELDIGSVPVTILRRLFPRLVGIVAMRNALADYPFLPCACDDGESCEWCEASVASASTARATPRTAG